MTPIRRGSIRLPVLTLAVGLTALTLMALACAPAAPTPAGQDAPASPAGQAAPSGVNDAATRRVVEPTLTESELATWEALPTMTPYPPGYVKPTGPPDTPTLSVAEITATLAAEEAALAPLTAGAAGGQSASNELLVEVMEYARENSHYAVARVRVSSTHRDVIQLSPPVTYRRLTLEILSVYRGSLPARIEILTSLTGRPQSVLPPGGEFIMFLEKYWVLAKSDNSPYSKGKKSGELSRRELDALGGEAYFGNLFQLWIIDGNQAHQVPISYTANPENPQKRTHLEAAHAAARSLPLADLVSTLRALPPVQQAAVSPPTPTPQPEDSLTVLASSVDSYDAVARVRVLAHRDYAIRLAGIEWPEASHRQPAFLEWRRSQAQVVEIYHGELPDKFDIVNDFYPNLSNQSPDAGREYVLFLVKKWLPIGEYPNDDRRVHYTPEQLAAIGGEGYAYFNTQTWVIDGENALRAPREHIIYDGSNEVGDHLAGARRGGVSLSLSELAAAIRAGRPE